MRENRWLLIRIVLLVVSIVQGVLFSNDLVPATKLTLIFGVLVGIFLFFGIKIQIWFFFKTIKIKPFIETKYPSWRFTISGQTQTFDLVGWYALAFGSSAVATILVQGKHILGGNPFFISLGITFILLNWIMCLINSD
jgi:hypothetical protein